MKTIAINNNTVIFASMTRSNGYGQYSVSAQWIDADGNNQEATFHSTDSRLFDNYDDENTHEIAQQEIAKYVINKFYSI